LYLPKRLCSKGQEALFKFLAVYYFHTGHFQHSNYGVREYLEHTCYPHWKFWLSAEAILYFSLSIFQHNWPKFPIFPTKMSKIRLHVKISQRSRFPSCDKVSQSRFPKYVKVSQGSRFPKYVKVFRGSRLGLSLRPKPKA
jgi:hypothetical protein